MASGTINGSTGNEYIDAKIEWSTTPNTLLNYTTVTAILYYKRNNTGYTTSGTGTFSITIRGETTSASKTLTITENGWVKAVEATQKISHRESMTIGISASGSIPDTSLSSTSVSGSITLDAMPSAIKGSTIDSLSCETTYFNGKMTYKYTPVSNVYYNRCVIALNLNGIYTQVKSINLGKQATSQQTATVTLAESELATIYNKLPSTSKGTLRFTIYTYSDSEYSSQKGEQTYKEITLNVQNDLTTKPYATNMTLSPVSSLEGDFAGVYLQGLSKVKVTSTEAGQYGATVVRKSVTVEGKSYGSESNYTSDYLTGNGTVYVKLTIEDSRGFINTKTLPIDVIPYSNPRVIPRTGETSIVCARCDSNGNLTDSGSYLRIRARRSFSLCMINGVQKNFCGLRYRYKKASDSDFSSWQNLLLITNTTEEVDAVVLGTLSTTTPYVVQIDAVDSIPNHSYVKFDIPTEDVYLHKAGSIGSLGIGEYVEDANTISIAKSKAIRMKSNINGLRMYNKAVSGTAELDINTKYADFTGTGNERQTFFVFGEANGTMVYGVARAANNGTTLWSGTTGVTLKTKSGGILTVVLPKVAYDIFTIISGRDFSV